MKKSLFSFISPFGDLYLMGPGRKPVSICKARVRDDRTLLLTFFDGTLLQTRLNLFQTGYPNASSPERLYSQEGIAEWGLHVGRDQEDAAWLHLTSHRSHLRLSAMAVEPAARPMTIDVEGEPAWSILHSFHVRVEENGVLRDAAIDLSALVKVNRPEEIPAQIAVLYFETNRDIQPLLLMTRLLLITGFPAGPRPIIPTKTS